MASRLDYAVLEARHRRLQSQCEQLEATFGPWKALFDELASRIAVLEAEMVRDKALTARLRAAARPGA